MRTVWEIVNSDLLPYAEQGYAKGYESGIVGDVYPTHVLDRMSVRLDHIEYQTFSEGCANGYNKAQSIFTTLNQ